MTYSSRWLRALPSGAARPFGLFIALAALALTACGDDPSEPEDIDIADIVGTWELDNSEGSFYLDIEADTIRSYSSLNEACFFAAIFSIEDIDGRTLTLSNGETEFEARFDLDGEVLVVDGQEFTSSDDDLGALDLCDYPADAVCTDLPELTEPDTIDGTIAVTDREDIGGFFYDFYSFRPAATTNVTIELRSTSFDSYLILFDDEGDPIASDDDSGAAGEDARLITSLEAGCYMVMATTFSAGEVGAYVLVVE